MNECVAAMFENGIQTIYVPLCVTDTIDGEKGGYLWNGKIIPSEEADENFWAEVNRKYPPIDLLKRMNK